MTDQNKNPLEQAIENLGRLSEEGKRRALSRTDIEPILALLFSVQQEQVCPVCKDDKKVWNGQGCCGGIRTYRAWAKKQAQAIYNLCHLLGDKQSKTLTDCAVFLQKKIADLQAALANANIVIKSNTEYELKERQKLQTEVERLRKRVDEVRQLGLDSSHELILKNNRLEKLLADKDELIERLAKDLKDAEQYSPYKYHSLAAVAKAKPQEGDSKIYEVNMQEERSCDTCSNKHDGRPKEKGE
jgi:hypothetical protein